jgi:hypothetical protein
MIVNPEDQLDDLSGSQDFSALGHPIMKDARLVFAQGI